MPLNQDELPSIAIAFFCYNQEKYIEESLQSCLNQDYKKLTIIISDDCSTDKTYEKIEHITNSYTGPHVVKINRNKKNLGIGKHFAYVMDNLIDAEFVVMCAGDDISKKNRVTRVVEEWVSNGKPSLVAHNLIEIDENGEKIEGLRTIQYKLQDYSIYTNNHYSILEHLKYHQPIPFLGAAVAYKKNTYDKFGSSKTYLDYEDHLMYFRALLDGGIHYFNERLVKYRRHRNSYMAKTVKPFHDKPNSLLSCYFDKDSVIKEDFRDCYNSHKISVQQWIDYTFAIKNYNYQVDYQLIENLWNNIQLRHKHLIKNKNEKLKKEIEINYIKPLNTVIFGTSQAAINLMYNTVTGFKIIAACNNIDKSLSGKSINGVKILNFSDLNKITNKVDCILVASNKFHQIKNAILKETKISEHRIVRIPALYLHNINSIKDLNLPHPREQQ